MKVSSVQLSQRHNTQNKRTVLVISIIVHQSHAQQEYFCQYSTYKAKNKNKQTERLKSLSLHH